MGARRAQAWGFVSRIMVSREGGGSEEESRYQCAVLRDQGGLLLAVRSLVVVV